MNKKDYYENKIMYALQKIDYAQSKLAGVEHKNRLATLYFVLLNYKKVDMATILDVTKLDRDEVVSALHTLRKLGLTDWNGMYLRGNKEIQVRQDTNLTFSEFVKDLNSKYEKKYGTSLEKDVKIDEHVPKEDKEEWVEIKYSDDIIMKVKKDRLKRLL